jgi:aspartyl-tRNA(Asn)/glutamyl-tRNA(Gln) amidotransferase subunit A
VGSIVGPSVMCGLTALRPTYGVVSRAGVLPYAFSFDKAGPLCRTAQDCAAVVACLAGHDPADASTVAAPHGLAEVSPHSAIGLRAAVMDFPDGVPVPLELQVYFGQALDVLTAAGVKVERAALPDLPWQDVAHVIVEAEGDVAFEDLVRSGHAPDLEDPLHHGKPWYSLPGRPSDYVRAQTIRAHMQRVMMRDFFKAYDLVISAYPALAPPVDEPLPQVGGDLLNIAGNVLGLPVVTVPMGFAPPGKLPVGFVIAGRPMEDAKVLAAAALFQSRTWWHRERPPILAAAP